MIAVFVNCGSIIIGSLVGLLFARRISESLSEIIRTAAGFVTTVIGVQMAFKYQSIVILALSLIIGGILGSLWDWDGKILSAGRMLEKLVYRGTSLRRADPAGSENVRTPGTPGGWNFAYGFLNASVLFCVGAMAILGSFKAGIEKDYTIIFTKSILDGFMAVTFAAAMGPGTLFSCLSVFIYQGALTLLSVLVKPYVTAAVVAELTASGGVLIMMIGINLLGIREIKTANYLPAVLLAVLFALIRPLIQGMFL